MTTIDVFWTSLNPEFVTRGYYDCGFLEDILGPYTQHRPADAYTFQHHDVTSVEFPHYNGAVICFSGMGNAPYADELIEQIDKMAWALVVIMGNEMWDFPWERLYETDSRRVWVMNPLPEHAHLSNRIPGGPYPNTKQQVNHPDLAVDRQYDWFFGGQVTNPRRKECVHYLGMVPNGHLIKTDRFLGGVPVEDYNRILVSSKAVPCPSGPMTLDANRPLAAMEAGCVPILDMRKPHDPQFDYWKLVFGDYPMPVVFEWSEGPAAIDQIVRHWPHRSNDVFSWWQQWKRKTVHKLHDDIAAVSGIQRPASPDSQITALITTSPIPSHPDTSILEETIQSIRDRLPSAEIIIAFDGVRPEQQHQRADYDEYIRRVLWKCQFEWTNVVPFVSGQWGHQANTTRRALQLVFTECLLFMEHDTPLVGDIPWQQMIDTVNDGMANVIRLHQDSAIHPDHERVMLDRHPQVINDMKLRRTSAWWQRPHVASTMFYKTMIEDYIPHNARTMIEDLIYPIMWVDCNDRRRGWGHWLVWVYTPDGDMRRSGHSDGRKDQDKFDMFFGTTP